MEYNVDAKLFYEVFEKALTEISKDTNLLASYTNHSQKVFPKISITKKWTSIMERVYVTMETIFHDSFDEKSKKEFNLYCKNYKEYAPNKEERKEHQHIDATFFDEKDLLNHIDLEKIGLNVEIDKIWNLKVAVEHENSFKDNLHEVKQLLQINVPLRVIISYSSSNKTDAEFEEFIAKYFKLVEKLEYVSRMKNSDEFLLIFGNDGEAAIDDNFITYRAVVLKHDNAGKLSIVYLKSIQVS